MEGSKAKMMENVLSDAPVILVSLSVAVMVAKGESSNAQVGRAEHVEKMTARRPFGKCNLMIGNELNCVFGEHNFQARVRIELNGCPHPLPSGYSILNAHVR